MRPAHVDLADLALLHVAALLVDDAQRGTIDDVADGAGLGERLLRIVPHHDAGLGGAVVLVDDRSPPVDHLALHGGRAGRGAMGDPAQRGDVVAPLDLVGQAQQAHEHGGHDVHVADLVAIDQPQHVLGLEARLQHHAEAKPRAAHAVGGRRRVIHRAVHHHDDRGIGLDAPVLRRLAGGQCLQLGRGRPAPHALGPAGRARGVDHAAARHLGRLGVGLRCARRRRPRSRRQPAHGASRPAHCRRRRSPPASARPAPSRAPARRSRSGPEGRCAPPAPWRRCRPGCSPPPPA